MGSVQIPAHCPIGKSKLVVPLKPEYNLMTACVSSEVPWHHLLFLSDLPPATESCSLWTNGFGIWSSGLSQYHKHPGNKGLKAESRDEWQGNGFSVRPAVDQRFLGTNSAFSHWPKCRLADPEFASKSRRAVCRRGVCKHSLKTEKLLLSSSGMMSQALSKKRSVMQQEVAVSWMQ